MKGTKVMSQISTFEDIPLSISFFTANISDEDMIFYYSQQNTLMHNYTAKMSLVPDD